MASVHYARTNFIFTCERFFLFKQLSSPKSGFVPSYLFLDFVFILFPTLGCGRSQHSLVWTPTSSHQCLLKAQSEQPAAPARHLVGQGSPHATSAPTHSWYGQEACVYCSGADRRGLPSHSPRGHTSTASTFLRSMLSICSENFFTSSKPSTSLIFRVGSTSLYFYPRESRKSCWAGGSYGEGQICYC